NHPLFSRIIDASNTVDLRFVVIRIVEGGNEGFNSSRACERLSSRANAEYGIRICEPGLEPKLIRNIFHSVPCVVDINLIENSVVELVEVWATGWLFEWNSICAQRDKAASPRLSTSKCISVCIVSQWVSDN